MAIKNMRNFRQFLKESNELPILFAYFTLSPKPVFDAYEKITREIEQLEYVDSVDVDMSAFTVYFKDLLPNQYNGKDLTDFIVEFVESVDNIVKWHPEQSLQNMRTVKVLRVEPYLEYNGLPKAFIDFNHIVIKCQPNQRLSGIHKLVQCHTLTLTKCENVVGNVLNLMQVSGETQIDLQATRDPEWVLVVRDFLDPNDRDIINCKEALMNNNCKEYAKL